MPMTMSARDLLQNILQDLSSLNAEPDPGDAEEDLRRDVVKNIHDLADLVARGENIDTRGI